MTRAHFYTGQALYVRSARQTARTIEVRAVLRLCVPNKALHPLLLLFPANPLRWASPGYLRPCVRRTLQNLIRRTLPIQLRNSGRFTGDTLYPHHDNPQNLFPLRLTAVARRGRPMRAAAESGAAQRGGAARASTTAHNWESQARKDSGGHVPFSDRSGPGRPGRRGSAVRACAPDARHTPPIELPLGPGPQAKYPHPPSRPLAK